MYTVYGIPGCPFCSKAKALLTAKDEDFTYVDATPAIRKQIFEDHGHRTAPAIYKDEIFVGGYAELAVELKHHTPVEKALWWVVTVILLAVNKPAGQKRLTERQECIDSCNKG